ncbi:MAG: hypothetical protein LBG83_07520 [Oscillospiraceae bacterium]|nr:hypothetical protein [Oscillospiraceae bacterium]
MTDKTTLEELGAQYAAEADNLEAMIFACKERRRFAIQGGNSAEANRLEQLMELHAQQRNDLLRLSVWLRHYYGESKTEGGGRHAGCYGCIA